MSERGAALLIVLGTAVASSACGGPEQRVVDQYFNALKQNDSQTITSFALVAFDKKVDNWKITGSEPETKASATLPELSKKVRDLEAELAANKKASQNYANEAEGKRFLQIQEVKDLQKKNAKIPANLAPVGAAWDKFNEKDRDLKKALAEAKDAVEKEKRRVVLSLGQIEDVENQPAQVTTRKVDLSLTIAGEAKPYVMTLRKYDLTGDKAPRVVSRWVVESVTPRT
ncbi:MAG TPA: hypothetical protein VKI41_00850 [Vicinamibacteria bacterium]|nr:hypothetical protein [Vicinamibacteria bacterium]